MDRDRWQAAVARGALAVPLPDGERVLVENLREVRSAPGLWIVAGTVFGSNGRESAVVTFGEGGVFAVLPTPRGLMEVRTEGGRSILRAAGDIRPPEGIACPGGRCPPWLDRRLRAKSSGGAEVASDIAVPERRGKQSGARTMSIAQIEAAHAAGPITIDLLGLISSELAFDAGAEAAARTEFQHLVAVANQAYADSGTNLVFNLVGIDKVSIDPAMSGRRSLDAITENDPLLEWDVHARRDETSADLVALLRPYTSGAWECGLGWLGGFGLAPDSADPAYGYSMTRTAPCGPYVLAHELGHNLGSHHDLANALDGQGELQRGAYLESHGLRRLDAPAFATVMAYEAGEARAIGRFSDPARAECRGVACGLAGYSDNVASLRRMGPRIARFRDPSAAMSLHVGDVREGESAADVAFTIRWATPAPAGGRAFRVLLREGTATAGQDFEAYAIEGVLAAGESAWSGQWRLLGDALDEGDESLELVVEGLGADAGTSTRAALVIIDDDPKARISGQVAFTGAEPPSEGVTLHWLYADAAGVRRMDTVASAPTYAYAITVPMGARLMLERTTVASPFGGVSEDFGRVQTDASRTITLNSRVLVSGRLTFEGGGTPPSTPLRIEFRGLETPMGTVSVEVQPPEFAFEMPAKFGNAVSLRVDNLPMPWFDRQSFSLGPLRANTSRVLSIKPGVRLHGRLSFDVGVAQPVANAEIWVDESRADGNYFTRARLIDGEYEIAVAPGVPVKVEAFARGVTDSARVFLGSLRGATRHDFLLGPAAAIMPTPPFVASEGGAGAQVHRIPVVLSRPAGSAGAFATLTQVDGAARYGEDYEGAGSLSVAPGSRVGFAEVTVRSDAIAEGLEAAVFKVEPVSGVLPTTQTLSLHIVDPQDSGTLLTLPALAAWTEGDTGVRDIPVPVQLSRPAGAAGARATFAVFSEAPFFNMPYAVDGVDVSLPEPEVVFAPGQQTANLVVRIHGDTTPEYDEYFHVGVLELEGIDSSRPSESGGALARVLNDDRAHFARPDQLALLIAASPASVDVPIRMNDANFGETSWLHGQLSLADAPRFGTVSVEADPYWVTNGGRARYTPPARLPMGRDRFRYRSCGAYWSNPCAEADVDVRMLAFPAETLDLRVDSDRGHRDFERSGHPSIAGLRFETTPLVAAEVDRLALGFDAAPADAFDDEAGTATRFADVAPPAEAKRWMLHVRAASAASGDIDLHLGVDRNGNGRADRDEVVCAAAMSAVLERCDHLIDQAAGEGFAWWVRVHNRGVAQEVRLERYLIPLAGPPGFTVSSKAQVRQGEPWAWRVGWTLSGLARGESMTGALRVKADDGLDLGWVPVRFERESGPEVPAPIAHAANRNVALAPGQSLRRAFFDVPPGIGRLEVEVEASAPVDVRLVPLGAPPASAAIPTVRAVGNETAARTANGLSGREVLSVDAPSAGQWFVQVSNPPEASTTSRVRIIPRAVPGTSPPRLQPGSYFNADRAGHGLFVYPAGPDWAGLWYTYLPDGTPTWFYLQGRAPADSGTWTASLFRSRWYGTANQLTPVGAVTLTLAEGGKVLFSHTVDGETGSESMQAFGRGCPSIGGSVVDASGHWFDPRRAGSGYSVQLFPNYEFYAVFGYDEQGEARYLAAELPRAGGLIERFSLDQIRGFCPLCSHEASRQRRSVGFFEREIAGGRLAAIRLQANYVDGVGGTWTAEDAPTPLGNLQGCASD